jgi:uncharacterized protein YabN with tetrapyrrole methylase and pyrophosphatase domain
MPVICFIACQKIQGNYMQIRVIGSGIRSIHHLTLEAVENLKKTKKILFFPSVIGMTEAFLTLMGLKSYQDLSPLYINGDKDINNYKRIVDTLIADAKEFDDIAFLVPGNPRLGVTTLTWLEKLAAKDDIKINIINGISSFDTMMNDICRDPLSKGTTIYDANVLLKYQHDLNPNVDHYIYHVCSVGTANTHYKDASKDNKLDSLVNHLLRYFKSDHPCMLIESSAIAEKAANIQHTVISHLAKLLPKINFGTTLFIKAAEPV